MANYFKENMKFFREKNGLSKNKLGELTGVNQTTIGRWETGEITPSIDNVVDLLNALKIPLRELGNFLGKDLRVEQPKTNNETEQFELLKDVLKNKGILDNNDEMSQEDFDRLIEFAKVNKQFIMKDKKE